MYHSSFLQAARLEIYRVDRTSTSGNFRVVNATALVSRYTLD
jgi:hypothetical protein